MLYLGADHAGFKLKEGVKKFLDKKGIKYKDLGAKELNNHDDYVDYAYEVGKKIRKGTKGILFCGSGFGMCIAANKLKNVRAVNVYTAREAELARMHNDANILCLSGWMITRNMAKKIITKFLNTKFSKAIRHTRRLKKIKMLRKKNLSDTHKLGLRRK